MTLRVRILLLGTVACMWATMALAVPAAQAATPEFGVEKFVTANCLEGHSTCVEEAIGPYSVPKEPSLSEAREGAYTQAAGHPAFGVTAFKINTIGAIPEATPTGIVTHVRTDVARGVSTNPEAVGKCTMAEFEGVEVASGIFTPPTCKPEPK
jgi:hypothetical protein